MIDQDVYMTINQGENGLKEKPCYLMKQETVIGRVWEQVVPDIQFASSYISRKHAVVVTENDRFFIIDLKSKHGTRVNHTAIGNNKPFLLHDGDIISLARGVAVLTFHNANEKRIGDTLEFPLLSDEDMEDHHGLFVNMDRREIMIDGVQIYLSSKDTELFGLLYQMANSAVSYDEIRTNIWPERAANKIGNIPDVGREEVTTLVYRLRKKLAKYGQYIISVPRYGYMLDLQQMLPNLRDYKA
ncbi:FHA domain-containing protein [Paenibacillus agricola]|jgi:DNA-binding winged helix-turn-helix (wHTH) protein|uniref:FHA domain-containing protein n=1 Tax=Paenibacillus agricola TaxID=2716264 RepID=A0ABX0JK34_9BACL|nr:FHA domain-containing protein [Paenibacillus agricola]NHN35487.1 FHA domain-containing protein [Paenibacillus agricola]